MELMFKPIIFICIIFLAAALKKAGLFQNGDSRILSKIVMNFTLPAAIISSFVGFEQDTSLLLLIPIGFLSGFLPLLVTFFITKKLTVKDRIYYMINLGGHNIGSFTLPIMTSFFGAPGIIVCVMFDVGNAVMMTGGSYAMTNSLLRINGGEKEKSFFSSIKILAKGFFTSFPLDVYLLMLLFIILNFQMPSIISTILSPISSANAFLSMFMVGLMFQFSANKTFLKDIIWLALLRLGFSACFAFLTFFFTPFPLEIRQILAVVAFAPIGSLAPIFVEKSGGDSAKSGFATTVSIIASFVVMVTLSTLFLA